MSSSFNYSSDEASALTSQPSELSQQQESSNQQITTTKTINSKYNDPNYCFEADSTSNVYIFKYGLFSRTLLPIDNSKEREMILQCTT